METMLAIIRFVHIAAGALALVAGAVPLISQKGSSVHRRWGRVYMGAMGAVLLTAVLLSLFRSIPFLMLIAVFSTYLVLSGYRSLYTRYPGKPIAMPDILLTGAAIAGGAGLIGYGVHTVLQGGFGIVPLVFGAVCVLLPVLDIRRLRSRRQRSPQWLFAHLSRMIGAYISTVTAFLVVNVHFLPVWLVWLLPAVVGTLAIVWCGRRYGKKQSAVSVQTDEKTAV